LTYFRYARLRVVLTTLKEQPVLGKMALILAEHKRTATALEDSGIAKIPKDVFDKYMTDSPRFISTYTGFRCDMGKTPVAETPDR
jgi:CRP-like cAMP-binding protein